MERWEIRASPNADDPQRHLLLLRGGVADVAAVLKKFGALCGRPTPLEGDDFNMSFVLHKLTPEARAKVDAWLEQVAPKPAAAAPAAPAPTPAPAPAPTPAPAAPPPPAPAPALPPMPSFAAPSGAPPPPAPATPGLPAIPPPAPALGIPSASDLPPPKDFLKPVESAGPAIPEAGVAPKKEPLISLGPDAPPIPPPAPAVPPPAPAPATPPAPAPTEVRMATPNPAGPAPAPAAGANPAAKALTEELKADWTFETLLVGAYNRFAHAAAMSVVTSPGSMYNPLFLYGVPGTGKSHLMYAIASSMSKGLGTASLMVTSGARLSRAVSAAAAAGGMAAIDKKVADSKALFVDDIHLLALTEQNKDLLAKLFKAFFDRGQQVVLTSMYPPKALGAIEEALKFQFSKGWSVDLKVPNPNIQRDLVAAVCDRIGAGLGGDEIGQFADKLTNWGYQDLTLWARRLGTLRKIRSAASQPAPLMDMLRLIYEPITIGSEAAPPDTSKAVFAPPAPAPDAEPLAVLSPKGNEGAGAFACTLFYDLGGKNGFKRSYKHVLTSSYDSMQQVGVPFQIADMCHRAGVTRALIVGPGPDSPLAPRAAEFGHAVRRILESGGVSMGWIPFSQIQIGAHYLNAHLDFDK